MENTILEKAIEIIENYHSLKTAPKIAIFGPPESGKTAFLERLIGYCEQQDNYPIIPFHIDLKSAPISSESALYEYIFETLSKEIRKKNIDLGTEIFPVRLPLDFDRLIEAILSCTDSYITLFIDHIDSISFERAMGLVHRFHYFSDQAAKDFNYKRLGLCIAGIKSLFELRSSLHSVFVSYDIIRFPRQSEQIQGCMVEEQVDLDSIENGKREETLKALTALTGGESVFLKPLLECIDEPLNLAKLEIAQDRLYKRHANVFRHLALRVWTDPALQEIISNLLDNQPVPQRSNNPDIDKNQLTGAVVLLPVSGAGAQKKHYKFRNDLVKGFLYKLRKILYKTSPTQGLAVSGQIARLNQIKENCEKATNLTDFFNNLEAAWKDLTDFENISQDDLSIKCYVANRKSESFWQIFTKPALTIEDIAKTSESGKEKIEEIIHNWKRNFAGWNQQRHTYFEWTEQTVTFTYTLRAFDNFLIALSLCVPTNLINNEFTEFTAGHWIRFVKNHRMKISELIFAEFGRVALQENLVNKKEDQITRFFSITDDPSQKRDQNILYFSQDWDHFFATRSKIIHLTGKPLEKVISKLNEECKQLCEKRLTSASIKKELYEGVRPFYVELEKIKGIDKLLELNEKDLLYIDSYLDGLGVPFELIPLPEKGLLATKIPVTRRLRFVDAKQQLHAPFHIKFAKLKLAGEPFRVLIVANDDGGALKEVKNEAEQIKVKLKDSETEVVVSHNDSIERIEALLREKQFHLLHFCGHTKYVPQNEQMTGLSISSEEDNTEIVSYGRFARAVRNSGTWLVYLSSCHGAVTDLPEIGQTYLNCMEALIEIGIPNVIGFRWAVEDFRAKRFASEFYAELFIDERVINQEKSGSWPPDPRFERSDVGNPEKNLE